MARKGVGANAGVRNIITLTQKISKFKSDLKVNQKLKKDEIKPYLELYKKCLKTYNKNYNNYFKAISRFSQKYYIAYEENDYLKEYAKKLSDECDKTGSLIKKSKGLDDKVYDGLENIVQKIGQALDSANEEQLKVWESLIGSKKEKVTNEKISGSKSVATSRIGKTWEALTRHLGLSGGKSVLLDSINEQRKKFAAQLLTISNDFTETKTKISTVVGILNKRSINRNIYQNTENSPLNVLKKLHDALERGTEIPKYKNKDLLKIPKALDEKIENSMNKVINVKWEKYEKIRNDAGLQDLSAKITRIEDIYRNQENILNKCIKNLEQAESGTPERILNDTKTICESMKAAADENANELKESLAGIFSSVLSYKMGCEIIFNSLKALSIVISLKSKLDVDDLMAQTMVEKNNNTIKLLFLTLKIGTYLLDLAFPGAGQAARTVLEYAQKILAEDYDAIKDDIIKSIEG